MRKRFISALLSIMMTIGTIQLFPASALEIDEPYPYTMFAGSEEDGAITINTGNVCMNGSIATNGTIESTAANFNVNGQRLEHAQQTMIYAFGKLDRAYFDSGNVLTVDTDYTVEDINISLNEPVVSLSSICLNGNVNLNTQLKAEQNIQITGNSCNANNAALISHYGDIYIDSENFGYSGLIYAPYGDIVIESSSTNLNNVIVIGQTITIECPNLNVNYNTNAANIIGTISEDPDDPGEDDYLYAVGSYNEETNAIDISWSGNHLPDSVDIMVSADGEDYTLAATATDASVYAYPVGDNFISAYFKVSYTGANGNTVESLPFQASATEDGIVIDYPDSDGDSISDIMESILKTDPNKADTDDDGLTDQQELYITGTDPLVYDSAEPTVSDADADIDADSISNIDEIELGTDPQNPDTDDDRLTDREEVTVYLTDPQLEDTDGDSLNDGFEIRYGLDPLSPYTDGISDAERQIEQHIAADNPLMDIVNTEESPYEMSVQITMHGDAERELSVLESGYSVSLETDAQIGAITDVILPDSCEPEALRLTYAIKDAYRSNTLNKYTQFDDMQGIKRLCVFRYYDEIGMMLPLETQYDLENNTAYADVNMAGTYCVMDLEQWFDIFDVDPEQVQINATTQNNAGNPYLLSHTLQENTQVAAAEPNNTPISIYILLPCTGHNETLYKQQVSELEDFGSEILVKYPEAKISVFTVRNTFSGNDVEVNITSATYMEDNLDNSKRLHLNPAEYNLISDQKSVVTSPLYSGAKSGLIDDESQYKFVYDFQNSNIVVDDRNNALDLCENHSCYYSRIYSEDYHYFKGWPNNYTLIDDYSERIHQAILDCGGIDLTDMNTVAEEMVAHIREIVGDTTTYEALLANRLKYVSLDARLSPDNQVDTDEDTLTDWKEADTTHITVNANGTVTLPTVQYLISHANIDINNILNAAGNISAARDAMFRYVLSRQVLPCKSDPTMKDTDRDTLDDAHDHFPLLPADKRFTSCTSDDFNTIPELTWVNERKRSSEDDYCKYLDYAHLAGFSPFQTQVIAIFSRLAEEVGLQTITDARTGIVNYGMSTELSILCSMILVWINTNQNERYDWSDVGVLYHAPQGLEHYCAGTGETLHYDAADICELISSSPNNIEHLVYNMTKAMQFGEQIAQEGTEFYFTSTADADLKVTCFDNKGFNCIFLGDRQDHSYDSGDRHHRHHRMEYFSNTQVDWHNTVGESFGGIRARVTRNGNRYTMHYRYCMNDIYEWTPKRIISLEYQTHEPQYDTDDLGTILHALHQLGTAKEFLIDGSFVGEITWEEGASADDKFVFDQIADTMKNIEGNSRWAWSNCYDVYVGDKSPTSIDYRTIP